MKKRRIYEYYESEGKKLKKGDIDKYYRGVFRFFSTHGSRTAILEKWMRLFKANETFLDVGCELGYFVRKAAARGLHVTGIDISPTKIQKAKYIAEMLNLNCQFLTMDAESLDFEDNCFDWVLCSETLEHILNDQQAARELVRVAKKNIIITVPQKSPFWRVLNHFSDIYGFESPGAGHLREYTTKSLMELFENDVELVDIKKGGYFIALLDKILPDLSIFKAILCILLKKV